MNQLFYSPDISTTAVLTPDDSKHCVRVLRLGKGDVLTVTNGKGMFYRAIIDTPDPAGCRVTITERFSDRKPFGVHIAVAPTKNAERIEWFVEKATEIGIDEITFLKCKHSERHNINLSRIEKVAVSAMKQSLKGTLPRINQIIDFKKFISIPVTSETSRFIAHCRQDDLPMLKNVLSLGDNSASLILIGPEGDFSAEEVESALAVGFIAVSLGTSRLRTETAALVACHTVSITN
ncbi:MAG: 16S rRNA (uracil(1498)-N(3))-methyltransferase [Tannerella sp.]|nr:16S rRNA (uracil(1498)-N(3))-methyltransferase [Tannerella sp.]